MSRRSKSSGRKSTIWLRRLTQLRKINESKELLWDVGQRLTRNTAILVRGMSVHYRASFLFQRGATVRHVLTVERLIEVLTYVGEVVCVHALLVLEVCPVEHLLVDWLISCLFRLLILIQLVVKALAYSWAWSNCSRLTWVTIARRYSVRTFAHYFHTSLLIKLPLHPKQVDFKIRHFVVQIDDFCC